MDWARRLRSWSTGGWQAFAELNGAKVKFVEDAARAYEQLIEDSRIIDFALSVHFESLHSHDAVAVLCRGVDGGFRRIRGFFQSRGVVLSRQFRVKFLGSRKYEHPIPPC